MVFRQSISKYEIEIIGNINRTQTDSNVSVELVLRVAIGRWNENRIKLFCFTRVIAEIRTTVVCYRFTGRIKVIR